MQQLDAADKDYATKPLYEHMFKPHEVSHIIKSCLENHLADKEYDASKTGEWSKEIAKEIQLQLKTKQLARYKYIVQVFIGEMKGAGVQVGARCLWDTETDKMAREEYINNSLYCVAVAFGVYLY